MRVPKALEKYNIEKDIAAYIKKEFDKKYGPTWHCIVGRNFGACGARRAARGVWARCGAHALTACARTRVARQAPT